MAAGNPWNKFETIATCPVCLGFFTDPMSLGCGHNLCRRCIDRYWGEKPTTPRCPECETEVQPLNFIANSPLADFVEIVKEMNMEAEKPKTGGVRRRKCCERHQQPLKLFCKDDETPICEGCEKSVEHQEHKVVPVEEVPEEYKNWRFLETVKKVREKVLACQGDSERRRQKMLEILMNLLKRLHQFWGEQWKVLQARKEELEEDVGREADEKMAELTEKLATVQSLIQEMEEKRQQPGDELLQGIRSFLQKYEKEMSENPTIFPAEKMSKVWDLCNAIQILDDAMEKLRALTANIAVDPNKADL